MKKAVWSGERIGLPPVRYPLAALVGANTRDTSTPWVAEIVGLSAKYGYERRFLRGKEDWTRANSPGSRGVYFYFTLEEGRYYEAYRRVSNNQSERLFLKVTSEGEIVEVSREEVDEWLHRKLNVAQLPANED